MMSSRDVVIAITAGPGAPRYGEPAVAGIVMIPLTSAAAVDALFQTQGLQGLLLREFMMGRCVEILWLRHPLYLILGTVMKPLAAAVDPRLHLDRG